MVLGLPSVITEEEKDLLGLRGRGSPAAKGVARLADRPVDLSGPDILPAEPGTQALISLTDPTAVEPTFDTAFGNPETGQLATAVGPGIGEIRPEDLFAVGGPDALQESQRPSIGIGTALELIRAANGKTTGTQRADPVELNPFQRVMLGIADVMAVKEGKIMPSVTLKQQTGRALTLQDQNNRQAMTSGMKFLQDMVTLGNTFQNKEDRVALMASQIENMERTLPGSGAMGLTIASNPNESDALFAYLKDPNNFKGTLADRWMNFALANAFVNPPKSQAIITKAFEKGIFSQTILATGPAVFQSLLGAQIEEGRRAGGEKEVFANKLASGEEITVPEYLVWQASLSEKVKADPAYNESLARNPEAYLDVPFFSGFSTATMVALRKKKEVEGLFSSQVAMINTRSPDPNDPEMIGGPHQSKRILELGPEWIAASQFDQDALFGVGNTGGPFGPPGISQVGRLQEDFFELRKNIDELVSIDEVFRGDLLTAGARIENTFISVKSYFSANLSPEEMKKKREFIGLRTQAVTSLSATLNRLSGAAVSPQEFERIKDTRPAPDDNPADFRVKLDTAIALNVFTLARINVWEMSGDPSVKFPLNLTRQGVRNFIKGKGEELIAKYENEHPTLTQNQRNKGVARDLAEMFGVREKDLPGILSADPFLTLAGDRNAIEQELNKEDL